jgi:hypothetical protein
VSPGGVPGGHSFTTSRIRALIGQTEQGPRRTMRAKLMTLQGDVCGEVVGRKGRGATSPAGESRTVSIADGPVAAVVQPDGRINALRAGVPIAPASTQLENPGLTRQARDVPSVVATASGLVRWGHQGAGGDAQHEEQCNSSQHCFVSALKSGADRYLTGEA